MKMLILSTLYFLTVTVSAQAAVITILDNDGSWGSKGIIETLRQDGSHVGQRVPPGRATVEVK